MPPLPRLRLRALDELARQLRFEPPAAAARQLHNAEALVSRIEPGRTYPEDWLINAITGYRPRSDDPDMLVGGAILADLPALVERLCIRAGLTRADLPEKDWIDAESLCKRWAVSRRTLDRYRKRGLCARRVASPNGEAGALLYFARAAVESFERDHAGVLSRAASFSRMSDADRRAIIDGAREERARSRCTLNQAALRLSRILGRSHEAVRQVLIAHDREDTPPIFSEPGPITPRQREFIERATRRGVEPGRIAIRLGKSSGAVGRALTIDRAQRLRSLHLGGPLDPAPLDPARIEALLSKTSVCSGLALPPPRTLADMLAQAGTLSAPPQAPESERARAYWLLRRLAADTIASLDAAEPSGAAVDEAETMLRWAHFLKLELARSQLGLALRSIADRLGRPVTAVSAAAAPRVADACCEAVIFAVDRFDPFRGGRLASPAGLELNRALAVLLSADPALAEPSPARAAPKHDPARVPLTNWTAMLTPWSGWLLPPDRVREHTSAAPPDAAAVLLARNGWAGGPPRSRAAVARSLGKSPMHIAALERRALKTALDAARRSP